MRLQAHEDVNGAGDNNDETNPAQSGPAQPSNTGIGLYSSAQIKGAYIGALSGCTAGSMRGIGVMASFHKETKTSCPLVRCSDNRNAYLEY
ncbi:hypothetical protein O1611_g10109 [Lasiodiplodia mahajangana]|uniref:Uncharacterized protein n=1 Tax=Lasiodiplodia mahajangana TaxID=1108764 RepID=A0ACC2J1R1_9PEZI|nr:hypothetical protein O1611_g10109 [Lasiodiplodia mahajangana]